MVLNDPWGRWARVGQPSPVFRGPGGGGVLRHTHLSVIGKSIYRTNSQDGQARLGKRARRFLTLWRSFDAEGISSLTGPGPRNGAYRNSNHILLDWAPAPDKVAYRNSSHILLVWAWAPDKAAYRSSSHILLVWALAPDKGAYRSSSRPPIRWRIEARAISSSTGPRPPIRGRIESQSISSSTGPDPLKGGVSKLKPYPP